MDKILDCVGGPISRSNILSYRTIPLSAYGIPLVVKVKLDEDIFDPSERTVLRTFPTKQDADDFMRLFLKE